MKICKSCRENKPIEEFYIVNDGVYRTVQSHCKKCHSKIVSDNRHKKGRKRMAELRIKFGSKCIHCGGTGELHFDHIDPSTKEFTISQGVKDYSFERVLKEAAKCQLLCRACHEHKTNLENRS